MQIAQVVGITGHSLTLRSKGRCAIKPRSAPELRRYAAMTTAPRVPRVAGTSCNAEGGFCE